ncbi:phenylalanyl-tRNA synthetase, beta subunit family protein [Tritrichomonas foetus]|uniref:phenylalanine--tRNA ligase n=1 Tax=Tritrichomonas foetus TaxID=1144522 RepID=A0A1J4KYZ7_9EUKA|nr:phenylalanyl-tRNA synthetase, beta subunit family protein [Tritrichomonas foetus]|eukprot:OHT14934.1 phenylalanyl-tRNA synthetase, beta subunit family protein [Tritrichomonas foetus]
MPVVSVSPARLYHLMGVEPMEQEKLRELLLQFGLELDEVVEEEVDGVKVTNYKIDVPANRADLLSVESIAIALKVYLGGEHPKYSVVPPQYTMNVDSSVDGVRPLVICAVLRNVTFTKENYNSFIDYQDKLHQNLCRRRTLASIGTHDLDLCKGPFTYTAEPPEDIKFVPLTGGPEVNGRQLFETLHQHQQLSKYLYLIEDMPKWPVIRDAEGHVMSLPPIINSDRTKITLDTKNVFIECTALDYTRAMSAVVVLCCAFSLYSSTPFQIEQVNVVKDGKTLVTPIFDTIDFDVELDYIRKITSLKDLTAEKVRDLLWKMSLQVAPLADNKLKVTVPQTRTDILHPCDIAEDVAIAYGYNAIFKEMRHTIPAGRPLQRSEYIDRLSKEVAACKWIGICPFSLCSRAECYDMLLLPETPHIELMNSTTKSLEMPRTTLLPSLLGTAHCIFNQPNVKKILPLRLFLIDDVILLDDKAETRTRNEHRFSAIIADTKSRFDKVHGLLDRFFILNGCKAEDVKLVAQDIPTCIKGQRAAVMYKGNQVGWIGVLHPQVLINFGLTTPVVAFEICIDTFIGK